MTANELSLLFKWHPVEDAPNPQRWMWQARTFRAGDPPFTAVPGLSNDTIAILHCNQGTSSDHKATDFMLIPHPRAEEAT